MSEKKEIISASPKVRKLAREVGADIYQIQGSQRKGRVSEDDIKAMARPVLRHRLITNFNAEAEGLSTDDILSILLEDDAK